MSHGSQESLNGSHPRRSYHVTSRHYYTLREGVMHELERVALEDTWLGKARLDQPDGEFRLLSIVFDETEKIAGCHACLVLVKDGQFDPKSLDHAHNVHLHQELRWAQGEQEVLPEYKRQVTGWPADWQQDVATRLGVPLERVLEKGAGSHLLTAHTSAIPITTAARMHAQSQRLHFEGPPISDSQDTLSGSVEFRIEPLLKPWHYDPESYLQEVVGQIKVTKLNDDDSDTTEVVGELKLIVIKLAEAVRDRVALFHICDCHSGDLVDMWATLFDDQCLKEKLGLKAPSGDLLYLDDISIKPEYEGTPLYYQAIETAITTFASRGLVVAYRATFEDKPVRWQQLGFEPIRRSLLLVRTAKSRRFKFKK